ncbi:class II aldolase/adducin family protein [Streptomyces sp. MB09-01]|uniref:class II aldolase/adducin family protein n=1 Tax=Streptomyces sp. MB09-01 TaxID=3028666 RepID=UPI0029AD93A3|nr:class II aldolase/adducin family protein [Streptomyces sp. MB09-01]MDX3533576.1 class II aldolase/adducin family protein [Streptomyces sp. MB09-01]
MNAAIGLIRREVGGLHRKLVRHGPVVRTPGHASAGVPGEDLLVIKPSGVSYDELSPQNVILCDLDGNVVMATTRPPPTPPHTGPGDGDPTLSEPMTPARTAGVAPLPAASNGVVACRETHSCPMVN